MSDRASPNLIEGLNGLKSLIGGGRDNYPLISGTNDAVGNNFYEEDGSVMNNYYQSTTTVPSQTQVDNANESTTTEENDLSNWEQENLRRFQNENSIRNNQEQQHHQRYETMQQASQLKTQNERTPHLQHQSSTTTTVPTSLPAHHGELQSFVHHPPNHPNPKRYQHQGFNNNNNNTISNNQLLTMQPPLQVAHNLHHLSNHNQANSIHLSNITNHNSQPLPPTTQLLQAIHNNTQQQQHQLQQLNGGLANPSGPTINTSLHNNNNNSNNNNNNNNTSNNTSNNNNSNSNNNNNNNSNNNNNNNSNPDDNSRWTQYQVQQLWRHHAYLNGKSNKDICGDEKHKEDGDPWNVEAQAAFLGPNLWDKTLPYDTDLKVHQYADLDEFLSENGIPVDGLPSSHLGHSTSMGSGSTHRSDSLGHCNSLSLGLGTVTKRERSPSPSDCMSPDTINNPPSPADSTFSMSSSRDFDPRTRAFSDEELKPQPMIKKSRKQFVPDEMKDDKYWARRRKNNMAAKRSRDARRMKENQIALRAGFLEKENMNLHREVEQLKQENMELRARLSKYQEV
ncbi:unnamed protein product [Diamesa tonsa]